MGSTPNSSRLTSMKATTSCVGAQLRPEETGRPLQNFVGPLEFSGLLLKIPDPLRLHRTHPGRIPVVDVGLAHPGPHRFHAIAELESNPVHRPVIGAQLGTQGAHHPHRSGLLLRAVPTTGRLTGRLFLRHDSILVSKVWSLRDFQGDSRCLRTSVVVKSHVGGCIGLIGSVSQRSGIESFGSDARSLSIACADVLLACACKVMMYWPGDWVR